jgi:hypothetical protein
MEKAILKAIEGGYQGVELLSTGVIYYYGDKSRGKTAKEITLDIDFWIALGKTEGWTCCGKLEVVAGKRNHGCEHCDTPCIYQWHRFIDHLAQGGDAESFFITLLANK